MMDKLRQLCLSSDHCSREAAIHVMLQAARVTYELQDGEQQDGRPHNFVITFNNQPKHRWIFGAHYDIDPQTLHGANDNSAAVIQLLQLAADLTATGYTGELTICFWDMEEPTAVGGALGAFRFAKLLSSVREDSLLGELVLVLDVCGVGDTIGISQSCYAEQQAVCFEQLLRINNHPCDYLSTPYSDNLGLQRAGLQSVLAVVLPRREMEGSDTPATWHRLHTPADHIDTIQSETMQMMLDYLHAWVQTLEREKQIGVV